MHFLCIIIVQVVLTCEYIIWLLSTSHRGNPQCMEIGEILSCGVQCPTLETGRQRVVWDDWYVYTTSPCNSRNKLLKWCMENVTAIQVKEYSYPVLDLDEEAISLGPSQSPNLMTRGRWKSV